MKRQFIVFCLLNFALTALSQKNPYQVKFSYQIEKEVADEKIRSSKAGLLYSLIGDYHNSNLYSDIAVSWGVDSLNFNDYKTKDALKEICEKAKNHRIVIISENHLKPQHRIFATKIIKELAGYGFNHLGLETFMSISNKNSLLDSMLSVRGYPLDSPLTGTYTLEPKMGVLVRKAIYLKYNLFAYEKTEKIKGKDRDEIQADNIIRYLNNNPNAKVIILCGFHHAIESDLIKRGNSYWMAKYLKDKLEIDPITIYQDNFTEKFIKNEHPLLGTINIDKPSILIDSLGEVVKISHQVDFEVIHPKTSYIDGRPNWLFESEKYKAVKIKLEDFDIDFPIIVSAYPFDEINSVPVDRIELKHKYDRKPLVLKVGKYKISIYDGARTYEYIQTVE